MRLLPAGKSLPRQFVSSPNFVPLSRPGLLRSSCSAATSSTTEKKRIFLPASFAINHDEKFLIITKPAQEAEEMKREMKFFVKRSTRINYAARLLWNINSTHICEEILGNNWRGDVGWESRLKNGDGLTDGELVLSFEFSKCPVTSSTTFMQLSNHKLITNRKCWVHPNPNIGSAHFAVVSPTKPHSMSTT